MSLSKLTVVELRELAKSKRLRGYSKLRKAELISYLRSSVRKSPQRSPQRKRKIDFQKNDSSRMSRRRTSELSRKMATKLSSKLPSKLSAKYRNEISWNGYPLDILKSGLQKYIRRGNLNKALYFAGELDLFKEAPDRGEIVRTSFLHRLIVIYLEDVENIAIFDLFFDKIEKVFAERKKSNRSKEKEEELISEIVSLLCSSKKARVCSHIRAVFNPKYASLRDSYPLVDSYWKEIEENERNERKKRLVFSLFTKYLDEKNILSVYYAFKIHASDVKLEKKLIGGYKPIWFIFNELLAYDKELVYKFIILYKEHLSNMKEGFLCWLLPLLYIIGIVPRGVPYGVPYGTLNGVLNGVQEMNWNRNREGILIEVDDYVKDKHTRTSGKKGVVEFALTGAFVENEGNFVNPIWKEYYENSKRIEEGVEPVFSKIKSKGKEGESKGKGKERESKSKEGETELKETEEYKFIVLTQINTSSSKMDVYFAKDRNNKLVVVKGPYNTRKDIDILVSNTEWKKKYGLPYINFEVKEMIPNRFPGGVPLGARNKINRNKPAYFLVFDSVIDESEIEIIKHSSKVWPETEVVNWKNIPLHFDYKLKLTFQENLDYVHALLYRYLLGISDLADRNILMVKGRVISIDEDIENKEIDLYKVLKKNKAAYVYKWIQKNYDSLDVQEWNVKYENDKEQIRRLKQIQNKEKCLRLFAE